ncbi:hypothetical protein PSHT_03588 [Puccinia striiformis]|uniref:Uncharacterized protein n=1 Tax=Puccinia striiformis TaxID=27350 RepID=A0A2S4WF42_9BASI|nr:hypothetical protein PSHT_03588 [Puccinia striiformis]
MLLAWLSSDSPSDNQPLTTRNKSKHTRLDRPYTTVTNKPIVPLPTTNRNQTDLASSIDWNLKPINQTKNIKLIQDTFALVKQQRLDRPPKPTPNQDHLLESSEERLDRIVA